MALGLSGQQVALRMELMNPGAQYLASTGQGGPGAGAMFLIQHGVLFLLVFAVFPVLVSGLFSLGVVQAAERHEEMPRGIGVLAAGLCVITCAAFGFASLSGDVKALGISVSAITAMFGVLMIPVLRSGGRVTEASADSGRRTAIILGRIAAGMGVAASGVAAFLVFSLSNDRNAGSAFFDPARGADPLLYQHFTWFLGATEVSAALLLTSAAALIGVAVAAQTGAEAARLRPATVAAVIVALTSLLTASAAAFTSGF